MYCKNCGTWLTDDSRFCQNCGAAVTGQTRFRQTYQPGEVQRGTGKKLFRVSAKPQARILGIPVSGRTALIVIGVVIIILIIANKMGG